MNQIIDCNVEYILPWKTIETIDLMINGIKTVIYVLNDSGYLNVFLEKRDLINGSNRIECFDNEKELDEFLFNYHRL